MNTDLGIRLYESTRPVDYQPNTELFDSTQSQAPFGVFRLSLTLSELRISGSIPDKATKDCVINEWRSGVIVTCFSFR